MRRLINSILRFPRWLLGYEGVGLMARPTFRYDAMASFFGALAGGVIIQSFVQLFARKSLQASPWIVALVAAEVAGGNLFGVFLGQFLQKRRRVRCMVLARLAMAPWLLAIACLPVSPFSAVPYALLLIPVAILAAVIINVQTSIWHSNYGEAVRGRIFSRVMIIRMAAVVASVKFAGWFLDYWAGAHHVLYVLSALAMVASALAFSRIRVRRERSMIRNHHKARPSFLGGLRLLKDDPAYGKFMLWQSLSGGAAHMTLPVVALILTDNFGVSYGKGTTAMSAIPLVVVLVLAPLAGKVFDHVGITTVRGINAFFWAASRGMLLVGTLLKLWPVMLVAFAVQGLAQSLGMVAFNIGHTRFARPDQGQAYMGVHMTLTGLRALTMPFVGLWLFHMESVGPWVLLIATLGGGVASAGFFLMKPPEIPPPPVRLGAFGQKLG